MLTKITCDIYEMLSVDIATTYPETPSDLQHVMSVELRDFCKGTLIVGPQILGTSEHNDVLLDPTRPVIYAYCGGNGRKNFICIPLHVGAFGVVHDAFPLPLIGRKQKEGGILSLTIGVHIRLATQAEAKKTIQACIQNWRKAHDALTQRLAENQLKLMEAERALGLDIPPPPRP